MPRSVLVLYGPVPGLVAALVLSPTQPVGVLPDCFDRLQVLCPGAVAGLDGMVTSVVALLLTVILFLAADATSAPRRLALVATSRPWVAQALGSFAAGVRRCWLVTTVPGAIVAGLDVVAPLEDGPSLALTVLAVHVVLDVAVRTVIQPRSVGDAVGPTSAGAFLSLIFRGFVLGPLGALPAIPATSFVEAVLVEAVLVDADPSARWPGAEVAEHGSRAASHRQDR